jgi:hypothetical protein
MDDTILSLPMTDPNGAAIYGAPWISTKTPVMLALIYQHHGSVMGYLSLENLNMLELSRPREQGKHGQTCFYMAPC